MTTSKTPYSKATVTIVIRCEHVDSAYTFKFDCSADLDFGEFEDEFVKLIQQKIRLIRCCQFSDFEANDRPISKEL
jgi:hypothetical protein